MVKYAIGNMNVEVGCLQTYLNNAIKNVEKYGIEYWYTIEREQVLIMLDDIKEWMERLDKKAKKEGIEI